MDVLSCLCSQTGRASYSRLEIIGFFLLDNGTTFSISCNVCTIQVSHVLAFLALFDIFWDVATQRITQAGISLKAGQS